MNIYVTNKSSILSDSDFFIILEASRKHLNTLCEDWNLSQIHIESSSQSLDSNFPNTIIIFDSIDDPICKEYDFEADKNSVSRIFVKTIVDSGGGLVYTDEYTVTVGQVLFKEIIGQISNKNLNKWYMDENAVLWWGDICSPVDGNIFTIDLQDGTKVALSDYVLPAYFGPSGIQGPFNKNETLNCPFALDDYGFSIKYEKGTFVASFATECSQDKIDQMNMMVEEFKLRFIPI